MPWEGLLLAGGRLGIVHTHQMWTWHRLDGCHGAFKSETPRTRSNMSRKEEIWQRPRLYCQSAVKGRRSCDVHWGTGQWILTCLRKTLTLQKTSGTQTARPSKTQIMPRVNVWNHSWKKHDLTLEKKRFHSQISSKYHRQLHKQVTHWILW